MTSPSEPRRSRSRRLRRWLATTGVVAIAAIALGAGTAGAYCGPYEDDDQVVSIEDGQSPAFGGGYVILKRSW